MQRVIFRKWRESGDVIAFFPDQVNGAFIGSYEHVGQHGDASYPHPQTVPASPDEYASLFAELKVIGYDDLRIVKRRARAALALVDTADDCACIQSGNNRCLVPANMTHGDIDATAN